MNLLKTKYLTPICFLIFFMPFLKMCDKREVVNIDQNIETVTVYSLPKEEFTVNAYQIGVQLFKSAFEGKLEKEGFQDKDSPPMFCYSLILIFSVLMVVFSWMNKNIWVRNLSLMNIILLLSSTIMFIKSGIIEKFSDLKYGWFVFLTFSLVIIFSANKERLKSKNVSV